MAEHEWGLCKDCKWWQLEPKAVVENLTMGLCIDEKLQAYRLRVSGNSGCNRFMPGKPCGLRALVKHHPGRNRRDRCRHTDSCV